MNCRSVLYPILIAKNVCVYGPADASYSHALPHSRDRDAVTQSISEITFGERYNRIRQRADVGCWMRQGLPSKGEL